MYEVVFYEDTRGNSPTGDFIGKLDERALYSRDSRILLKQIIYQINILERLGTRSGENFTKHIEDEIWELRPGSRRILFFMWKDNKIVLLHSFYKKTNKTPQKEIEKAKKEAKDWVKRYGK